MPFKKKRKFIHLLQAHHLWSLQRITDAVLATLVLMVGHFLLSFFSADLNWNTSYSVLAGITLLVTPFLMKLAGVYNPLNADLTGSRFPQIFVGWGLVSTFLLFIGFLTQTTMAFSRLLICVWLLLTPLCIALAHRYVRSLLRRLQASGQSSKRAIIAGTGELGGMLSTQIRNSPELGIQLCGFFSDTELDLNEKNKFKPAIGRIEELSDYVRKYQIDVVYLALSWQQEARLAELIQDLQDTTACVYFVPNITMFTLMQARTHEINGIPLIAVWEVPFSDLQYLLKRIVDILFSGFILLMLLPLIIAIALGVKLTSPGPVFFRQKRYGVSGQEIIVYKFRSMRVQENGKDVKQATRNDDRITKLGAFLRKTSLDELPQFINVLQGRMSIVGPRPHAIAHNEYYRQLIQGYMLRHLVKPGITGWAQVNGFRGETETIDKMQARIDYDLQYLRKWTLWLDFVIILQTVFVVLKRKNAY